MVLRKGTKFAKGHATVVEDDGVNYREIADTMTELGFPMNHSSARNYVLRVMRKFVHALVRSWKLEELDESVIDAITKDPDFQHAIAELLQVVELQRRARRG